MVKKVLTNVDTAILCIILYRCIRKSLLIRIDKKMSLWNFDFKGPFLVTAVKCRYTTILCIKCYDEEKKWNGIHFKISLFLYITLPIFESSDIVDNHVLSRPIKETNSSTLTDIQTVCVMYPKDRIWVINLSSAFWTTGPRHSTLISEARYIIVRI